MAQDTSAPQGVECYECVKPLEKPAWRQIRVEPPPGPKETVRELEQLLVKQKDHVERERRRRDIESDAGGESPYFNRLLLFESNPASYVLMQAMFQLGTVVAVHFKKRLLRPRPSQIEPRLRPMLGVPRHASYPSGHATQYFLVAKALASVVRSHEVGRELFQIAEEVAVNREWAGLHYASDTMAGKYIATAIFPQVESAYTETFQMAAREWL
jgi:hypothetical protein